MTRSRTWSPYRTSKDARRSLSAQADALRSVAFSCTCQCRAQIMAHCDARSAKFRGPCHVRGYGGADTLGGKYAAHVPYESLLTGPKYLAGYATHINGHEVYAQACARAHVAISSRGHGEFVSSTLGSLGAHTGWAHRI